MTPSNTPRTLDPHTRDRLMMTGLAAAAFIFVLFAWQTVGLSGLLYPFRLFVTLIHELGHGAAALVSGGRFVRFEVFTDGAGVAYTAGGNRLLILPAGYLGAALFGAVLLVAANRVRDVRAVAVVVAGVVGLGVVLFSGTNSMLFIGLLFAAVGAFLVGDHTRRYRTGFFIVAAVCGALLFVLIGSLTALRVGIGMAVVLGLVGVFAPRPAIIFVLNFLALIVGLNAIMDIWYLLGSPTASLGDVRNDAAAMGQLTNLPTAFWAGLWAFAAVTFMLAAAWVALVRPLRRKAQL